MPRRLKERADRVGVPYIFKSSYDKANRSSVNSFRGPGLESKDWRFSPKSKKKSACRFSPTFMRSIKSRRLKKLPTYCKSRRFFAGRPTSSLAVAKSGKVVNVKKGQFLAPWDMRNVVEKILSTGNEQILLTERGASFGYNNLVSDMRSLVVMRELGYPVVFDATHSLQLPGGLGSARAGSASIFRRWRAPGWRPASTRCSWRFMKILIMR